MARVRRAAAALPPAPDHSALASADPYAFRSAHRRLAWTLRLSAVANVVLVAAVIALSSTIHALLPLRRTEVALLRADPADDRVYRVEPIARDVDGFDLLLEATARRYVKLLLEIDPVSQNDRFREAMSLTASEFRSRFIRERIDSGELDDAIASGLNRSVAVESADRIASRGDEYSFAVDFVQVDRRGGAVIDERPLRAYLSIATRPHEAGSADRFTNPLGLRVTDLVLKSKSAEAPR